MRSGRAPWLLAALVWVLVVAAVGSVTYLVVDRAGRGIGDTSGTRPMAATSATPPLATSSPAGTPTPRSTSTSTASTPTSSPASRTESFSTRGGTVVATCTGDRVRLDSVTVRDGWRFETETEHGYLDVKLKSEEDDVELTIGCRGGVPALVDD